MIKKIIAVTLVICLVSGVTAYAGTPEFARTEEEWNRLRDNVLEYDEIDDLIKEFNVSVKSNTQSLKEYKAEKGSTNDSLRQFYSDMAAELRADADYSSAATSLSAVMNESAASSYEQLADSALDDYETERLGYEMAEKTLAMNAKSMMISYYSAQLDAEKAGLNTDLMKSQLDVANVQSKTGTATDVDVLSATESLMNAQKEKTTAEMNVNTTQKKLQVMCGWRYADTPVFGGLPEPDLERIAVINPDADIQTAIDNNYTLRINRHKLANASSDSAKDSTQLAIDSNITNISISLNSAYSALMSARLVYDYAVLASNVQQRLLSIAEKKHELGDMSDVELKSQQAAARTAGIAAQQAEYSLLQALMTYDYNVAGIASA